MFDWYRDQVTRISSNSKISFIHWYAVEKEFNTIIKDIDPISISQSKGDNTCAGNITTISKFLILNICRDSRRSAVSIPKNSVCSQSLQILIDMIISCRGKSPLMYPFIIVIDPAVEGKTVLTFPFDIVRIVWIILHG